ncbi:transglycosylase SLT domain-containing protein [uncultured Selenomonas sp.]|uniref:transglycosylase SLT domain-containing protein n=1 Tax=uncultured Selenomonas sp. TaxID=159275 RepID=UPI0028DB48A9|nr:transglycosylase SLT domain-containing protein [uncultured Selenomonas sp.]
MKRLCIAIIVVLLLLPSAAMAMPPFPGGKVTSGFGERDAGGRASQFHRGVDIGTESGTPIHAPFNGFVEHGAGSGYIYWVEIRTPEGGSLFFGDCAEATMSCVDGYVPEGTVIGYTGGDAYDGPLGYSDGPHSHVEHRLNGTHGSQIDPVPYLLSLGVDLSGDVVGAGGAAMDNAVIPWGIESMQKIGESINGFMEYLVEMISKSYALLQSAGLALLFVLCVIDLALPILTAGLEFSIPQLVGKFVKYGILYVILLNWQMIVNDFFLAFVSSVSGTFVGDPSVIEQNVSQPQLLVQKSIALMNPALNKIASFGTFEFTYNLSNIVVIWISSYFVIGTFFVLACYVMVVYVEFYLAAVIAVFTLPFTAFGFTKFVAEGSLGGVVSNTIKLALVSIMVGLCVFCVKDATVPKDLFDAELPGQVQMGGNGGITGPPEYIAMATAAAQKYGVPVNLFLAQIQLESNWNPNAVSEAGAQGIAQFMPETAAGWGIDPFNPEQALDASAHYMKNLYEKFGDWNYALAGYNGGPYSIERGEPLPAWANEYINLVYQRMSGSYVAKASITTEQSVKHLLMCVGLIALAVLTMRIPKVFMRSLGGRYEL